jgi:transcriptional regulator with XRE-family HTH domain
MAAREAVGLSQAQVAEQLGISQPAYADWERRPVALRPDQVERLTQILKISSEQLYGPPATKARGGPVGKARRAFEQVSKLPRNQQKHIIRVVEDLLVAQRNGA